MKYFSQSQNPNTHSDYGKSLRVKIKRQNQLLSRLNSPSTLPFWAAAYASPQAKFFNRRSEARTDIGDMEFSFLAKVRSNQEYLDDTWTGRSFSFWIFLREWQ